MKMLTIPELQTPKMPATPAPSRPLDGASGSGFVELAIVQGQTRVVRLASHSPLRLLAPRQHANAAWIVCGSYGGGLLAGDRLELDIRCGPATTCVLSTQATTKVFRASSPDTNTCSAQALAARLDADATLISWPDPVTCFAGSRYEQLQQFDLRPSSSLLSVDWLTSGRMARGEHWAFDRYSSRTRISVNDELCVHDAITLDAKDGLLTSAARTGGMHCLGVAWLIGPRVAGVVEALLKRLARVPIDPRRDVQFAISLLQRGGVVLRFAGRTTESASRWLRTQLSGVTEIAGFDPWSRRGDGSHLS